MLWISLWLFQVTQHCLCFLHSHNKNQKLDTSHTTDSHQYAELGREDAFQKQSLNTEGTIV